jgi:UDP-N-acetylmuramoyl-tripeptide--D-alanyl-D-alanine ligase
MKRLSRSLVVRILGWQVRRLRKRNTFKVVGVAGSIGKTSTKFAIANVLKAKHKVRFQEGNYNDLVSVPLIFFGSPIPSLFNPVAWLRVFIKNEEAIGKPYPYDVVVVEIGTDGPGQIAAFGQYLHCDITVVTAITPEHMEFFEDLDHVAQEEFSVSKYSDELVVNTDYCDSKYLDVPVPITTFGDDTAVHYQLSKIKFTDSNAEFEVRHGGAAWLSANMSAVSKSELYSATAAAIVANKLGVSGGLITKAIAQLQPVSGRMQRLKGIKNSLILDETYNASPEAVKAALDSVYGMKATQKIAILGNMNELGSFSPDAHCEVGAYCDPKQLDLVVTLGPDANEYLAPAAIEQGCLVKTFNDPYTVGEFVRTQVKEGAVILVKGSQNNVYAEEAVKALLANPKDVSQLVRQSEEWLHKKQKNFKNDMEG